MSPKISILLPETAHKRTKALAEELLDVIPDSEMNAESEVTLQFTEDVGPQFITLQTPAEQIVFKIIDFKSRADLGLTTVIKKENSQLVLNNFTTQLGVSVANVLMKLFPINVESNQIVNFTVHKDFIFFRIYRACFKQHRLVMGNIGPHLTLRLWRTTEYVGDDKKTSSYKKYVKNLNLL